MANPKGNKAPRSSADNAQKDVAQSIGNRPMMVEHIDYGIITEVDYSTYQVQIQLFGDPKGLILGKRFYPLLTQVDEIFHRYGQLRKGMHVRVHWRGRGAARFVVTELIADETGEFLSQQDRENELITGPFKLLS